MVNVLRFRNGVLFFIVSGIVFEICRIDRRPFCRDGGTGYWFAFILRFGLWMRRTEVCGVFEDVWDEIRRLDS